MTTQADLSTFSAPAQARDPIALAEANLAAAMARDLAAVAAWDALQAERVRTRTVLEAIAFQGRLTAAYTEMAHTDHEVQVAYRALRNARLLAEREARR